ncbi:MAG: mannose-6-phosphate isomerase, class I [Actinomycetota bacterium]
MDLLQGSIQPYTWGDPTAIPELQGRTPSGGPEAELWLGAHPAAPSRLLGLDRTLDEAVAEDPAGFLGAPVRDRFGRFPFLLKVLAAAEPLSIQVHPSLAQAKTGFEREERHGPAIDDPGRTYRDDNHKPELICALTDFEAKCGFRNPAITVALVEALATRPAAAGRMAEFAAALVEGSTDRECLTTTLEWMFELRPEAGAELNRELLTSTDELLADFGDDPTLARYVPELQWLAELDRLHPGDVGVPVSLLLNHVRLAPGEGLFLPAGNLHAYLRGVGVELMANSDNVIRGGLTVKHIDVAELLTVVDTTPMAAPVQSVSGPVHRFDTPVPEFALTRVVGAEIDIEPVGPEIILVTEGRAGLVVADGDSLELEQGSSALLTPSDGPCRLSADDGSVAWRATVGDLSLSE